ncbi:MAG: DNA recombination protein RmuC [Alphaproteobacteria bacterium]
MEKQESLESSIHSIIEKNFEKIDTKFEKSSSENTTNLFKIQERISLIDRAQQNINHLTENVVDLKNILSNTSKRGRFGEILLENLIKDTLPKEYYDFQKTLSNNSRVDCMIKISGNLNNLCIDSKFPKESYDKMVNANTKEDKVKLSKSFKLDISNHVLDVKKKYIIPGETAEIALIFIPSEQIYVEVFNLFPEITQMFYDSKIFLISPTTLWIVLNSIESLLKDQKINQNSNIIFQHLRELGKEIVRLEERIKKLDSHFTSAQNDLNEVLITTKKISNKKEKILLNETKD